MKKKLIIAAAIAFAVFAVPFGSSALSIDGACGQLRRKVKRDQ